MPGAMLMDVPTATTRGPVEVPVALGGTLASTLGSPGVSPVS